MQHHDGGKRTAPGRPIGGAPLWQRSWGSWHGVEELAQQAIAEGRLIRVLADWSPSYPGFHLCYAAGVALAPAARAIVDALKAQARHA